jgi:hypothetical protein
MLCPQAIWPIGHTGLSPWKALMPAMMTAIFGFRPTTYLLNHRQMAGGTPNL